jgi:hypothetical protein
MNGPLRPTVLRAKRNMGVGGTKVLTDTGRLERHRQAPSERLHTPVRRHRAGLAIMIPAAGLAIATVSTFAVYSLRRLAYNPILISETSATPVASQPTKIADLFAGIHLYSLLGFVWFDSVDRVNWRLSSPAASAAFRRGAEMYHWLAS